MRENKYFYIHVILGHVSQIKKRALATAGYDANSGLCLYVLNNSSAILKKLAAVIVTGGGQARYLTQSPEIPTSVQEHSHFSECYMAGNHTTIFSTKSLPETFNYFDDYSEANANSAAKTALFDGLFDLGCKINAQGFLSDRTAYTYIFCMLSLVFCGCAVIAKLHQGLRRSNAS
jgi:hypothetical protein